MAKNKESTLEFWRRAWAHTKDDMRIKYADEVTDGCEKSLDFLRSCYDALERDLSTDDGLKLNGEIDRAHAAHAEFLEEIKEDIAGTAVQASLHSCDIFQTQAGLHTLNALWLLEKAIERNDAKSAAYLSAVAIAIGLSIHEGTKIEYHSKFAISKDRSLKAKRIEHDSLDLLLDEFLTHCKEVQKAPTGRYLAKWLRQLTAQNTLDSFNEVDFTEANKDIKELSIEPCNIDIPQGNNGKPWKWRTIKLRLSEKTK